MKTSHTATKATTPKASRPQNTKAIRKIKTPRHARRVVSKTDTGDVIEYDDRTLDLSGETLRNLRTIAKRDGSTIEVALERALVNAVKDRLRGAKIDAKTSSIPMGRLLTPAALCRLLTMRRRDLESLAAAGKVPFVLWNRSVRFPLLAVERAMDAEDRRVNPAGELVRDRPLFRATRN